MFSPKNSESENTKDEFKVQTWNPFRLLVLRLGLTEPAMTSPLNYGKYAPDDSFHCAYCGAPLFPANAKYDSGSGWPSFWRSLDENSVSYKREWDNRLECRCQRCSSHLGHVFMDGPRPEMVAVDVLQSSPVTDPRSTVGTYLPRFCINGAALIHRPAPKDEVNNQ
jgi:peptide-methionine (R)-S-oxide reductase